MKSTDAPAKQVVPFGTNGPRDTITATTPSGSNQASYDQGFPPITMTLKSAGGLPPKGQDMNQILYEGSTFDRYFAAGGSYTFDPSFASGISGYPLGARVLNSVKSGFWVNTVEDNTVNPENTTGALTGWIPQDSSGITNISGLTSSSVTLNSVQASKSRIVLNGTLTANINIVVPAWVKSWQVINNTVGAFTVTVKTPSGTGVAMTSGTTHYVIGDGVNITEDLGSAAFRAVGNGSNQIPDMSYYTSAFGSSGYQVLPSGLILQWGTSTATNSGAAVSFRMPFPTAMYAFVVAMANGNVYGTLSSGQGTRTGVNIYCSISVAAVTWLAIGV